MKKKILSLAMCLTMVASLFVACGDKDASKDAGKTSSDGKVLNIYCWNEEFKSRLTDHYPGYKEVSGTEGKIGDVTVKWNITPSDDNAYQNNLDEKLLAQSEAAADDKIDLFLVEADYAIKYVDTDYTMPVKDLGITDADVADQYQYTKDVVTDSNGNLKGVSWQGCPGVLIYRRDIAKEVLGSDDPAEVQKAVKDWATFQTTAATMKDKGYMMTATVNDTYRVFSNNVTSSWVKDGKINYDANIKAWVEMSKEMYDAEQTTAYDLWGTEWSEGFMPEGKAFCYFGPAWFVDFSMKADTEGSVAANGGWGATEGPQGFYWGGTWICAAAGTDNADLVKDIMLKLTCDKTIMTDIVKDDNDFVNNKPAMDAMAKDETYKSKVLGGMNPLAMYCAGVETIDLKYITKYDQTCNEAFQAAMKNYFTGKATYDEAIELFEKTVKEKHPELAK